MSDAPVSRILILVFTDHADSTALKTQLGDQPDPPGVRTGIHMGEVSEKHLSEGGVA